MCLSGKTRTFVFFAKVRVFCETSCFSGKFVFFQTEFFGLFQKLICGLQEPCRLLLVYLEALGQVPDHLGHPSRPWQHLLPMLEQVWYSFLESYPSGWTWLAIQTSSTPGPPTTPPTPPTPPAPPATPPTPPSPPSTPPTPPTAPTTPPGPPASPQAP